MYVSSFFFFNDTATTEIYTLSLHDALPISKPRRDAARRDRGDARASRSFRRPAGGARCVRSGDRKSTRLNSSHGYISYAVFCLKKKKKYTRIEGGTLMKMDMIQQILRESIE